MVAVPAELNVKWKGKTISFSVTDDSTVGDVREEVERHTKVAIDKQKYSPKVLPVDDLNKPLCEIKFFGQRKKPTLNVIMIGTPEPELQAALAAAQQPKPKNTMKKQTRNRTEDKQQSKSASFIKFETKLSDISTLINQIENEMNANTNASVKKDTAQKKRLGWTERLTQAQLKLDALCLPPESEISAEERTTLRKLRKQVVLHAEKLIVAIE
uniref:BAG domain-containing protein n=1 Tax=Vannella robusta TaxID=1487602 RepID=A0A7S4M4Q5_9EUKA